MQYWSLSEDIFNVVADMSLEKRINTEQVKGKSHTIMLKNNKQITGES